MAAIVDVKHMKPTSSIRDSQLSASQLTSAKVIPINALVQSAQDLPNVSSAKRRSNLNW